MPKFRGFIAIDIPINERLLEIEDEIKNTGADLKLVEKENTHITIKFLGDTDEEKINDIDDIIKDSVKGIEPFQFKLKGSGVFPNKNYMRVIWIGLENAEKIGEIAKIIDKQLESLGFQPEKRGFSPHLTIARVRSPRAKENILQVIEKYRDTEFETVEFDTIYLKKSDLTPKGPIYTNLREVKI